MELGFLLSLTLGEGIPWCWPSKGSGGGNMGHMGYMAQLVSQEEISQSSDKLEPELRF